MYIYIFIQHNIQEEITTVLLEVNYMAKIP